MCKKNTPLRNVTDEILEISERKIESKIVSDITSSTCMASGESTTRDLELYCSGSVTDYDPNDDSNSDAVALPYQFKPVVRPRDGERNRDSDTEDTENNDDRTQHFMDC
jgi:hypothetical protein